MITKKITRLVGLKKTDFDLFVKSGQIKFQQARLIPVLKTGDEGALTSIFLSTIRLVKEYRDGLFKNIKFPRGGKAYYYTEASFPDIGVKESRIDGLIIVVIKGEISDAVFFEMKNKNNGIDKVQIEEYIALAKILKINKLVTVSNEFVANPTLSPIKIKTPKSFSLYHFSWTYLITQGSLLLFKNDSNIQDQDQVEIMTEALHYFENPSSGIQGYTQMKSGWKELADSILSNKTIKVADEYIEEAVFSWYEEEKSMALLLSKEIGVLVKSSPKNKYSIDKDIRKVINDGYITGELIIKDSVSNIKLVADFKGRFVVMHIKVNPPFDKGNIGKISWLKGQLENCQKKNADLFKKLERDIFIVPKIKSSRVILEKKLNTIDDLKIDCKDKEIQYFKIVLRKKFGMKFVGPKVFISEIEKMLLAYHEAIVEHVKSCSKPTPKILKDSES